LAGLVKITKEEYDKAPPGFQYQMIALSKIKEEREREKHESMFGGNNNGT
jgi:hypothetical protein